MGTGRSAQTPAAPETPRLDRVRAAGPPFELGEWSLLPLGLERVLAALADGRETVVECGSGMSTLAIARELRRRGRGRALALEHDAGWALRVRGRLRREGLDRVATVVDAPLREHPDALDGCPWYAGEAVARLPDGIELLLVDGPPAGDRELELSRYPALPALRDRLAPGALVMLDDFDRPGERRTLARWQSEFGLRFELDPVARIATADLA